MGKATLILAFALVVTYVMGEYNEEVSKLMYENMECFSSSLMKVLSHEENLIVSPVAAHLILSMAAYGSSGKTYDQIYNALHLQTKKVPSELEFFQNFTKDLAFTENITLDIAYHIYINGKNGKLNKSYVGNVTNQSFRSGVTLFGKSNLIALANFWFDERTRWHIPSFFNTSDEKESYKSMVLLNAAYLSGAWNVAFNSNKTEIESFHSGDKTKQQVSMMSVKSEFVYGKLSDLEAKFIRLPYKNQRIEMVVIVPDDLDGLPKIVDNYEKLDHSRLVESGGLECVEFRMPKFTTDNTIDLEKPLRKLGMHKMFSNNARFYGIATAKPNVDKILQKTIINVDEGVNGEKSNIGTGDKISGACETLTADRPFMYKIVDVKKNVTLFSGFFVKP